MGPFIWKILSFNYLMTIIHSQTPFIIKMILITATECWSLATYKSPLILVTVS